MEIRVNSFGGDLWTFPAEATWPVRTLKEKLEEVADIPLAFQTLMLEDKVLLDKCMLGDLVSKCGEDAASPEKEKDEPEPPQLLELLLLHKTVDTDMWRMEIKRDYRRLRKAPEEVRSDCQAVLEVIAEHPEAIKFAGDAPRADRACALAAVQRDAGLLRYVSTELWADEEVMMAAVLQDPSLFQKAPASLKANRELARHVLATHGRMYCYCSAELKADRELVLLAARSSRSLLPSLHERFLGDREVVALCLEQFDPMCAMSYSNPFDFGMLSCELREDPEILASGLRLTRSALQYAGREQVWEKVREDGLYLKWAPVGLKKDPQLVEVAIRGNGSAFEFADAALRSEKHLLHLAISSCSAGSADQLQFASKELRADRDLVLACVKKWPCCLEFAAPHLRHDREIVLEAVSRQGFALKYACPQHCTNTAAADVGGSKATAEPSSERKEKPVGGKRKGKRKPPLDLTDDLEVVQAALRSCSYALRYASPRLQAKLRTSP
eukprot:TRINITY_DN91374_c0_g1_i1.p1 TRINITY_DN91374_c0_g1~~TRINITY_DN91374_c0_g1_i1.p1  ORF type:complete len:498 (+),score=103.69 TRINITY_DN91374_c0_g1_i1:67-1560(+)